MLAKSPPDSDLIGDGFPVAGASVAIFTSLSQCEDIWRRALGHCVCYAFQTFEWQSAWHDTIASTMDVSVAIIHVAAADGRTLVLLPLGIFPRGRLRLLQFLGGSLTDYNVPLIDRELVSRLTGRDLSRLLDLVLARLPPVDLIWLQRIPQRIEDVPNPMAELDGSRRTDTAFAATLPASFAEFTAARSTAFFSQGRRYARRLAKAVNDRVVIDIADCHDRRSDIIRVGMEQKARWLRQSGLPDTFDVPGQKEFYERITHASFQEGRILVASLRIGEEIVATMWGPIFRGRFCFLLTSYEERWKQYSVGRLLMENTVRWCIAQDDIDMFDLTVGDESYKRHWADQTLELYEYLDYRSFRGALFALYQDVRWRLKRNATLRGSVRTVLATLRRWRHQRGM